MATNYVDTIGRWGEGNIDLNNRIVVHNQDQSISTERSFSVNLDGKEVLLPTIILGKIVSEDAAIDYYYKTGQYLGKFNSIVAAEDYAERLHERQEWYYGERIMQNYNYQMGIKVNNVDIPDPSEWNYQVGDLDTSGSRDATGLLHRAYVATKINYEFSWNGLEWRMLQVILNAVNHPKFTLTAPDPRIVGGIYTGDYYVGDRTGKGWYYNLDRDETATFTLKLKFIEY